MAWDSGWISGNTISNALLATYQLNTCDDRSGRPWASDAIPRATGLFSLPTTDTGYLTTVRMALNQFPPEEDIINK